MLKQKPEPQVFLLVDRNDQNGVRGLEQTLGQQQATFDERQPFGVAVGVGVVDIVVVVLPVAGASVVGRVDVNRVYPAFVCEEQRLEGVVVLGVDDGVERLAAVIPLHAAAAYDTAS